MNRILELENRRRNAFYGDCMRNFEHLFVTTEWVKSSLTLDYSVDPEKVTVVYTGVGNIQDQDIDYDSRPQKLLFVAKQNYIDKGAKLLLEAFRLLRGMHPTVELVMVGPDPKAIGALPDEERITFHSYLEWNALELLFNEAYAFVMPSLYEPYGLVYLEAMKCGVPIICSNTGGMSTVVDQYDCGWSLTRGNAQELADIMHEALSNPAASQEKGGRGRSFVNNHCSWDLCAEKIIQQLEKDN